VTPNPLQDQVAIVGVASTGYTRQLGGPSAARCAFSAAVAAIEDAGLTKADIDGVANAISAASPSARELAAGLGLGAVTYMSDGITVIGDSLLDAVHAIHAGSASAVLLSHAVYRAPYISVGAAQDPFRRWMRSPFGPHPIDSLVGTPAYAAWAGRYFHDYGIGREQLGLVALNARAHAIHNPGAAMQTPLTMDDYLASPMVRDPLCRLDMDVPADGAEAFVLTSAARARDLPRPPVLVHAAVTGYMGRSNEDQVAGLDRHGQHVVAEQLWSKSEIKLGDVDLYYPYDGFSIHTLTWLENIGYCGIGEAAAFLAEHWDPGAGHVRIHGRVPVNSHGGSLSEAATQGAGAVREAVRQLRGEAGTRQIAGARTALLTPGGFFFNAQGLILHV
jgi:acetyl-CoA acetyltransferase